VEDVQLLTYSSCTLPGLTGVYGCRDDKGDVEIQFSLEAKRAGFRTLSSRRKTAAAFANRVLISASTSPFLDREMEMLVNLSTYLVLPCATAVGCDDGCWVIPMTFVFSRLIFSPTCALCSSSWSGLYSYV